MTPKRFIVTTAATALSLSFIASGLAQDRPPTTPPPERPGATPPATPPRQVQPTPPKPEKPAAKIEHDELLRAADVIGLKVKNEQGEDLGNIEDLAVELESGRIRYAVLSFGGFLNMGDKLFALPWDAIDFAHGKELIRLSGVERATLEKAPGFDKANWPNFADETWGGELHRHYGNKPYWEEETARERRGGAKVEMDDPAAMPDRKLERSIARASDLLGLNVSSPDKKALGEIEELMIDLNEGEVVFVVAKLDSVKTAKADNLYVLPWRTVGLRMPVQASGKMLLVANIDQTRIADVPSFPKATWPNMRSEEWMNRIHAYYGTEDDWVYGYTRPETDADRDPATRQPPRQPGTTPPRDPAAPRDPATPLPQGDAYSKYFETGKPQSVTARITKIDRGTDAIVLTLATPEAKQVTVRLAPATFIEQHAVQFKDGGEVTVTAVPATIDGKEVLIAKDVRCEGKTIKLRDDRGKPLWIVKTDR